MPSNERRETKSGARRLEVTTAPLIANVTGYRMSMPHRSSLLLMSLLCWASVEAQDVIDLAGVRPDEVLSAVAENQSVAESPAPFIWFGIPTRLPALARIFPSGNLYALPDGTVVGVRWERAYLTAEECEAAANSVREVLGPYFPADVVGDNARRCQFQSRDGLLGVGVSCDQNEGGFHNAMVELVHFATDKELWESLNDR